MGPLALGLFAIPELADLAIQKKSIAAKGDQRVPIIGAISAYSMLPRPGFTPVSF